jgi:hypothetical protein
LSSEPRDPKSPESSRPDAAREGVRPAPAGVQIVTGVGVAPPPSGVPSFGPVIPTSTRPGPAPGPAAPPPADPDWEHVTVSDLDADDGLAAELAALAPEIAHPSLRPAESPIRTGGSASRVAVDDGEIDAESNWADLVPSTVRPPPEWLAPAPVLLEPPVEVAPGPEEAVTDAGTGDGGPIPGDPVDAATPADVSAPATVVAAPSSDAPPARSEAPPPARSEAPPPARSEAPPPARSEAPPPARSEAPPPARSEAPPPARSEAPPPALSSAPPPPAAGLVEASRAAADPADTAAPPPGFDSVEFSIDEDPEGLAEIRAVAAPALGLPVPATDVVRLEDPRATIPPAASLEPDGDPWSDLHRAGGALAGAGLGTDDLPPGPSSNVPPTGDVPGLSLDRTGGPTPWTGVPAGGPVGAGPLSEVPHPSEPADPQAERAAERSEAESGGPGPPRGQHRWDPLPIPDVSDSERPTHEPQAATAVTEGAGASPEPLPGALEAGAGDGRSGTGDMVSELVSLGDHQPSTDLDLGVPGLEPAEGGERPLAFASEGEGPAGDEVSGTPTRDVQQAELAALSAWATVGPDGSALPRALESAEVPIEDPVESDAASAGVPVAPGLPAARRVVGTTDLPNASAPLPDDAIAPPSAFDQREPSLLIDIDVVEPLVAAAPAPEPEPEGWARASESPEAAQKALLSEWSVRAKEALSRFADRGVADPATSAWLMRVIATIFLEEGLLDEERLERALARVGPPPPTEDD